MRLKAPMRPTSKVSLLELLSFCVLSACWPIASSVEAQSFQMEVCQNGYPYERWTISVQTIDNESIVGADENGQKKALPKQYYHQCDKTDCTQSQFNDIEAKDSIAEATAFKNKCCKSSQSDSYEICREHDPCSKKDRYKRSPASISDCVRGLNHGSPVANCFGTRLVIPFDNNSLILTSFSRKALDDFIEEYRRDTKLDLRIVGHANRTGSQNYNLRLSKDRAETVRYYLAARLGILADRTPEGLGWASPINGQDEIAGFQRRVEISIVSQECSVAQ